MGRYFAPDLIGGVRYFAPEEPPGVPPITGLTPVFYRSIIMRASSVDPTAAMTATLVQNIGDTTATRIFMTKPDGTTLAFEPAFGTSPLVTVDQGTFAAYQYTVYNFLPSDIDIAGQYVMRHVYLDANGSTVSSVSHFTMIEQ